MKRGTLRVRVLEVRNFYCSHCRKTKVVGLSVKLRSNRVNIIQHYLIETNAKVKYTVMHKKQKKGWLQHLQKMSYFPKRPQACPEKKPEHPSLPDYSKAFSFHFQCRIRSKCDEKKNEKKKQPSNMLD